MHRSNLRFLIILSVGLFFGRNGYGISLRGCALDFVRFTKSFFNSEAPDRSVTSPTDKAIPSLAVKLTDDSTDVAHTVTPPKTLPSLTVTLKDGSPYELTSDKEYLIQANGSGPGGKIDIEGRIVRLNADGTVKFKSASGGRATDLNINDLSIRSITPQLKAFTAHPVSEKPTKPVVSGLNQTDAAMLGFKSLEELREIFTPSQGHEINYRSRLMDVLDKAFEVGGMPTFIKMKKEVYNRYDFNENSPLEWFDEMTIRRQGIVNDPWVQPVVLDAE